MILLVDNYDSFSYNLYQLAGSINPDMKVIRNDEMTIDEICALAPASIILFIKWMVFKSLGDMIYWLSTSSSTSVSLSRTV